MSRSELRSALTPASGLASTKRRRSRTASPSQRARGSALEGAGHGLVAHRGGGERGLPRLAALEHDLVLAELARGAEDVRGPPLALVRVAVEQLHHVLRTRHECLLDALR